MIIRRRATGVQGKQVGFPGDKPPAPSLGRPCESLAGVLARIFQKSSPEVLDLGPMCGETVEHLAKRGARVHVEAFEPPPPTPPRKPGESPPDVAPLRLALPDRKFHLVLAWEQGDFVPPELLEDFGSELKRVLRDGGRLFLFSLMKPASGAEPPAKYRLLADGKVVREVTHGRRRRRWAHSTREIERSLQGFSIESVHLQPNQMREFVAIKVGAKE